MPEFHATDLQPVPALPEAPVADGANLGPDECPDQCTIHKTRGPLYALAGWLAAALASVMVATIPYDPGEMFCGVWGCLPPLPAVAAMHLLWCVALGATVWAVNRWFPSGLRALGFVLLIASIGATAALVSNDLSTWMAKTSVEARQFWPKRIAYRIVTLTDVPLVQSFVVGAACAIFGRSSAARR
jgi:hypothetical protein